MVLACLRLVLHSLLVRDDVSMSIRLVMGFAFYFPLSPSKFRVYVSMLIFIPIPS
jgi:hypothetical protein